jgi:cytochrome c peroxidase
LRRIAAWLPAFLALIALLLGSRPGLVRHAFRAAVERARGGALAPDARQARPDSSEVALGRLLFFDPILSANKERACASCHMPTRGFSDGRARALAVDRTDLPRNAPGLTNVSDQLAFFWDGRAVSLEDQIDGPVHAKRGWADSGGGRSKRGSTQSPYRALFPPSTVLRDTPTPTRHRGIRARSAVHRVSSGPVLAGRDSGVGAGGGAAGLRSLAGKAQCSRCHFLPLTTSVVPGAFAAQEFTVIGVPADPEGHALDPDPGRYAVTRDAADRHAFKAPSLRNIARSAPYMHNGVFQTLDQVVRFYNQGGGRGLGLDVANQAPDSPAPSDDRGRARPSASSNRSRLIRPRPPAHVPSGLQSAGC